MAKVSLQQLTEAAAEHETRTQFKNAHPKWYKHAWRRGTLDQICAHMQDARIKWTKEILQDEALKYKTKSEFSITNPRAFNAARTRDWLEDICQHMQPKRDTLYTRRSTHELPPL
jgi:arginine/lysine/ornithine decarboxylase